MAANSAIIQHRQTYLHFVVKTQILKIKHVVPTVTTVLPSARYRDLHC